MKKVRLGWAGGFAGLLGITVVVGATACGVGQNGSSDSEPVAQRPADHDGLGADSEWGARGGDYDEVTTCRYGEKSDADGDGVEDCLDNCPDDYNPGQEDSDGDGIGDACDCASKDRDKDKDDEVLEGRMTGGGSVFTDDGERVTHGFQIRCDEHDSRQNLQVNWGGGEKFHLLEMESATCLDTELDEAPPEAGFDTYIGTGTGRYDGVEGATIEFTFTDDGEPGVDDVAEMVIRDDSGNIVLSVSGELHHGNHQAHAR